eukprot:scaffold2469_cov239-Pinguiococcus_pyrenoidosus.AAC.5
MAEASGLVLHRGHHSAQVVVVGPLRPRRSWIRRRPGRSGPAARTDGPRWALGSGRPTQSPRRACPFGSCARSAALPAASCLVVWPAGDCWRSARSPGSPQRRTRRTRCGEGGLWRCATAPRPRPRQQVAPLPPADCASAGSPPLRNTWRRQRPCVARVGSFCDDGRGRRNLPGADAVLCVVKSRVGSCDWITESRAEWGREEN